MLQAEQNSGIVEWRRGLLVLHSTDAFTKTILPRYFNTKNFKTLRRQLNYYGFVHGTFLDIGCLLDWVRMGMLTSLLSCLLAVRSFSTTGSTTTALWVNQDLAKRGTDDISSVLMLKRVEPCDTAKTAEGRRMRKELAVSTVEDDIGVSAKSLQLEQIRSMVLRHDDNEEEVLYHVPPHIPLVVHCHSANSTTTTLIQGTGHPLTAPVFPQTTSWFTENHVSAALPVTDDTESTDSSQCSDAAANLLLALSKSTPTSSLL